MHLWRHFPPVHASVSTSALTRAVGALRHGASARARAEEALLARYPGRRVLLTDSGTTALRLALRLARSADTHNASVALPAYACPDIATAAIGARFGIRLYDVDPTTLQPDWASLERVLGHGVTHVVGTHLFGRLVDMPTLHTLATRFGVTVIEDAAQHAGGTLHDVRGGALASRAVLSFGRGKGINAGGGGALLLDAATPMRDVQLGPVGTSTGWKILLSAAAADVLSHPMLYGIPSHVPALGLGKTVYHAPTHASEISSASASLLVDALANEPAALQDRRVIEAWYVTQLTNIAPALLCTTSPDMRSGALRFPVRVPPAHVEAFTRELARWGVVRSYPRTLDAYPEIVSHLRGAEPTPGAKELAERLFTLPTHGVLQPADREALLVALRDIMSRS